MKHWCSICGLVRSEKPGGMCQPCCRSYDKANERDSTTAAALDWAADRARRGFAELMRQKRKRKQDADP